MKKKKKKSRKVQWTLFSTLVALLAGITVRKAAKKGWVAAKKEPPPTNPSISGNGWTKALAWTAASGALAGMSKLVAEQGAEKAWEKRTGKRPPA
jgi:hypothetical protein